MKNRSEQARSVAIVLGSGDVGSAIAVALNRAGFSVVLIDEADPPWPRRGMAFTNAWYVGNAELDGEGACFCASLKSVPSVLAKRLIAATTWSWPGVATALPPIALVDTRARRRRGSETLRDRGPFAIGIGNGFVAGKNVDAAVELDPVPTCSSPAQPDRDGAPSPFGLEVNGEGVWAVEATRHGRFMTERRIGEVVTVGQVVGGLGNEAVAAPASGVLLGLSARGARIEPGDILVEVDPARAIHRCHGVGEHLRNIAAAVASSIANRNPMSSLTDCSVGKGAANSAVRMIDGAGPHGSVRESGHDAVIAL